METADQKADCIGETKAKVVVPVARAIVVAISATQVGGFVVPRTPALNPVGALMPVILSKFYAADRNMAPAAPNSCSCFEEIEFP